jgi:hypothetical protein
LNFTAADDGLSCNWLEDDNETDSLFEPGSEASEGEEDGMSDNATGPESDDGAILPDETTVELEQNVRTRVSNSRVYCPPPDRKIVAAALYDLNLMLVPDCVSIRSKDPFAGEKVLRKRMNIMKDFFLLYTREKGPENWIEASISAARLNR